MIPETPPAGLTVMVVGFLLSVTLPLVVMTVAVRGYLNSSRNLAALRLAIGVVLVTAVPTLLRFGFGAILPGGAWTPLVIRVTELTGLLIVLGVMHGE